MPQRQPGGPTLRVRRSGHASPGTVRLPIPSLRCDLALQSRIRPTRRVVRRACRSAPLLPMVDHRRWKYLSLILERTTLRGLTWSRQKHGSKSSRKWRKVDLLDLSVRLTVASPTTKVRERCDFGGVGTLTKLTVREFGEGGSSRQTRTH